jgi:hypothetical protein
VPIITLVSVGAGASIRLFGPESMGGMGDIGARIDAEIAQTGLSDDEIGHKVQISISWLIDELDWLMLYSKIYNHTEGKLVQVPGLPAMYDYEFFPQTVCRI